MRRRLVGVVAVLLTVALGACGGGDREPQDMRDLTADSNFSNGREAAGALATISARAVDDARTCIRHQSRDAAACEVLGVLSAWTQVAAVDVARCGRAGAAEARATLLELLDAVEEAEAGRRTEVPVVPPTPDCG